MTNEEREPRSARWRASLRRFRGGAAEGMEAEALRDAHGATGANDDPALNTGTDGVWAFRVN